MPRVIFAELHNLRNISIIQHGLAGGQQESDMADKTKGTITKTVWQYSKTLPDEMMQELRSIASDYCRVKNEVYRRYSGIKNMNNLTPAFNVMTQMRHCGLREQLGLPATYYEVAVRDAVTDIKITWGVVKNKIRTAVTANENLTADERMYIRTVLRIDSTYAAILNRQPYEIPDKCRGLELDYHRLNNLLCRYTRKYLSKPHTDYKDYFSLHNDGYLYRESGVLRIPGRIPRKKLSIPIIGNAATDRQPKIYLRENDIAIAFAVEKKIKSHADYQNTIYVHIGNKDMFTLSNGHIYGDKLWELTAPETERLSKKNNERHRTYTAYARSMAEGNIQKADRIRENNFGRKEYNRIKQKRRAKEETYINAEINRMLREEKPAMIVTTRPITIGAGNYHMRATNRKITRSLQGYVRKRLAEKCEEQSIQIVEINSKGTGSVCSVCGETGERLPGGFVCMHCKNEMSIALNGARNIEKMFELSKPEDKLSADDFTRMEPR